MKNNVLRIIGGQWRGRKLSFFPAKGTRPTPDRVREALFNWLMYDLHGADCLDAFSGSGALGIEALSRGAAHVTFLEQNPRVCHQLKATFQSFALDKQMALLHETKTQKWLQRPAHKAFDIIFLDPPFFQDLLPVCFEAIDHYGWLKPNGLLYVEYECELLIQGMLLPGWACIRNKQFGEVGSALISNGGNPC